MDPEKLVRGVNAYIIAGLTSALNLAYPVSAVSNCESALELADTHWPCPTLAWPRLHDEQQFGQDSSTLHVVET